MKEGWEYKKLGEVCDIVGGGTPDKKNKNFYGGNIPWATVRDMNVESVKHTEYSITKEGLDKSSSHIIHEGEVIIATRVGLGKVCLLEQDTAINQDLKGIVPKKNDINRKYLFYWFKFEAKNIISNGVGATVKGVKLSFINNLSFPCISLSEQHRIVSYLDAAFAKIDAVAKNAEDALNEAKALFQSALAKMMEPKEGWEEKKIRDIADVRSGYAFKSSEFKPNGKYQVLRIGNVKRGIILYHVAPVFMPDSLASVVVNKSILKKGDIIITQTGTKSKGDYGYTAIVDCDNLLLNQRVARLRVNKEINLTFLLFYTWTKYFRDQFFSNEGGMVGQGNVSLETIKQIKIIYPSIEEQVEIVSLLSTIYHKIELLESNLSRTLTECAALKQSILRQTFE